VATSQGSVDITIWPGSQLISASASGGISAAGYTVTDEKTSSDVSFSGIGRLRGQGSLNYSVYLDPKVTVTVDQTNGKITVTSAGQAGSYDNVDNDLQTSASINVQNDKTKSVTIVLEVSSIAEGSGVNGIGFGGGNISYASGKGKVSESISVTFTSVCVSD
jgi:hypothetical protein